MGRWEVSLPSGVREMRVVLRDSIEGRADGPPPSDWAGALRVARAHGLDGYLFPSVSAWPAPRRPPVDVLDAWRGQFLAQAVRAVQAEAQLSELVRALQARGVSPLPLKGAWLAERVYDDPARRPMCDLDILVPRVQLASARQAFAGLGYRLVAEHVVTEWRREETYWHPEHPLCTELQWDFWTPEDSLLPRPDLSRIWAAAFTGTLAGEAVLQLPGAMHLLYLLYHLLAHQWRVPVRAYLDIVLLGRRLAAAGSAVLELKAEAHAWRLDFRAPFAWQVAHEICDIAPPSALRDWMPAAVPGLERRRQAAVAAALREAPASLFVSESWSDFRQAGFCRRLAIAGRRVFMPREALRVDHARALRQFGLPGAYVSRLMDLLRRRGRDVCRRDRRRADAETDMAQRLEMGRWLNRQEPPG